MSAGEVVMYRDRDGAHFGYLRRRGYKWAQVEVAGAVKRVPLESVRQWPPVREERAVTNVRRGK